MNANELNVFGHFKRKKPKTLGWPAEVETLNTLYVCMHYEKCCRFFTVLAIWVARKVL